MFKRCIAIALCSPDFWRHNMPQQHLVIPRLVSTSQNSTLLCKTHHDHCTSLSQNWCWQTKTLHGFLNLTTAFVCSFHVCTKRWLAIPGSCVRSTCGAKHQALPSPNSKEHPLAPFQMSLWNAFVKTNSIFHVCNPTLAWYCSVIFKSSVESVISITWVSITCYHGYIH